MTENKTNKPVLEIIVDDGMQRISIKNEYGDEIGVFAFRPTDIGIIERYNTVAAKFDEIVAPLEQYDIRPDGTADENDTAAQDALKKAEERLFEACDYMFGGNMSEAFFGKMHPFSPVGGYFYCESALNKVGTFIAAQFDAETKKINKRVNKYVGKYKSK